MEAISAEVRDFYAVENLPIICVHSTGLSQCHPDLGSRRPINAMNVAGESASRSVGALLSRQYQRAAQMQ